MSCEKHQNCRLALYFTYHYFTTFAPAEVCFTTIQNKHVATFKWKHCACITVQTEDNFHRNALESSTFQQDAGDAPGHTVF